MLRLKTKKNLELGSQEYIVTYFIIGNSFKVDPVGFPLKETMAMVKPKFGFGGGWGREFI